MPVCLSFRLSVDRITRECFEDHDLRIMISSKDDKKDEHKELYVDIAMNIVPVEPKSCDHQGQGYTR